MSTMSYLFSVKRLTASHMTLANCGNVQKCPETSNVQKMASKGSIVAVFLQQAIMTCYGNGGGLEENVQAEK
jgi:hypothetical protein